ncbi:chromophore lyase CpcT/CpeT [Acaryochloris marina]|uniref:Chromophore lyase CpcT/CpeT n=1 Tax=Acaryochloris marina (strain MBIC 11017) TaxID=329726 RepID=A8ZML5_ACAM1|nr:chromophore lyase CpcT/CpeT [Acaryochloris marina]ABW32426.1 CpcT protein, putative [Acaryochloris marina MBIC11017]
MTHSTDSYTLAKWLAAEFSNQAQAIENPPLYAHIQVSIRPLPRKLLTGYCLYLEQAYAFMLKKPYRTRVIHILEHKDSILIENYELHKKELFLGGTRDPLILNKISTEHLIKKEGCDMNVEWTGHSFVGTVVPGKSCKVVRNGKTTYLDNSFEVDQNKFISIDRGRDPETDELIWGSIAGPFHFSRIKSFENELIAT